MRKLYLYLHNKSTHTLHINGFCKNARGNDLIGYNSEDEALENDGRAVSMCKDCMRKRDSLLLQYIIKKRENK